MVTAIIGRKVGMTQVFGADGLVTPVTVLKAGPCVVVQTKTVDNDGYEAVQIGLVEGGRAPRATKALAGHYKKANVPPTRVRREVKVQKGQTAPAPGAEVACTIFAAGESLPVSTLPSSASSPLARASARAWAEADSSSSFDFSAARGPVSRPSRVACSGDSASRA